MIKRQFVAIYGCFLGLLTTSCSPGVHDTHASNRLTSDSTQKPDPGLRVTCKLRYPTTEGKVPLSVTSDWTFHYSFRVPSLPSSASWNPNSQTLYIWGDLDFDLYGAAGRHRVSKYKFNQIVPQLMLGNAATQSGPGYSRLRPPGSGGLTHWVMQASYFWQSEEGRSYVQKGELIAVQQGDQIHSSISYDAQQGSIEVRMEATQGHASPLVSQLRLERPFPNDPLFSSWKHFFLEAQKQSALSRTDAATPSPLSPPPGTLYGRPLVNVESHRVDEQTLCSILPFEVTGISVPGIATDAKQFQVGQVGNFRCAGLNSLLNLRFD